MSEADDRQISGREALELAVHFARTSPDHEPVECPNCKTPMEHLWEWERAAGDREPPLVCPSCPDAEVTPRCPKCGEELEESWGMWVPEHGEPPLRCPSKCARGSLRDAET